jgi:hypothetical protein
VDTAGRYFASSARPDCCISSQSGRAVPLRIMSAVAASFTCTMCGAWRVPLRTWRSSAITSSYGPWKYETTR